MTHNKKFKADTGSMPVRFKQLLGGQTTGPPGAGGAGKGWQTGLDWSAEIKKSCPKNLVFRTALILIC